MKMCSWNTSCRDGLSNSARQKILRASGAQDKTTSTCISIIPTRVEFTDSTGAYDIAALITWDALWRFTQTQR